MRDFSDADRVKKRGRIRLPDNPGNLSGEDLARVEEAVRAAGTEGYVTCPSGWRIAKDLGVSRLDVGAAIDRLGIRVTECQLGCFAVAKTAHGNEPVEPFAEEATRGVEALHERGELTCANVFALARELGARPRAVAEAANARRLKFRQCQLGCF